MAALSAAEVAGMFQAMERDEVGMFVRLLYGEGGPYPITRRSMNRRLGRIARDAGLGRRVTVRCWQSSGRQLEGWGGLLPT